MQLRDMRELMSEVKIYESYAKYNDDLDRYETWDESCDRVFDMHRFKFKDLMTTELHSVMEEAILSYKNKEVLGAQRALQFGGDSLLKHEAKMYNCSASYVDRVKVFGETMYLLLCGAGVGLSIQKHHVAKLPPIIDKFDKEIKFIIEDSIEGWASAIDALMSAYFTIGGKYPEYVGADITFDYSKIREKGAPISGGFLAPGPAPLMKCIDLCKSLLRSTRGRSLHPIEAYDLSMYIADAVISGGVRRAAMIALFSPDDIEMMEAKTGNWYATNPQRARSNNSTVLIRDEISLKDLNSIIKYIKQFGEPGFILTDSREFVFNPCVEIGMLPVTDDGKSGFQVCNLTEINGAKCVTADDFYKACRSAAIIGTLQAAYTDFKYLSDDTKRIVEKEALLGVSITGWMNNPHILFDKEIMKKGATIVKEVNKMVAELIGINIAARTTCVKPSGNASVILKTANGIHGEHSKLYLRHIQISKNTEVAKILADKFPAMIENSVWNASNLDYCVAFPIVVENDSIFKRDLLGVKQLEYVKTAQQVWVNEGTNVEVCNDPRLRHNVSNTITVDDWDEVINYVYDNKHHFAGVSFIPLTGDRDYAQAPNAEVLTESEIVAIWGDSFIDSARIINAYAGIGYRDLWVAASSINTDKEVINSLNPDKIKFINLVTNIAEIYNKEIPEIIIGLKDVYYLDKWNRIQNSIESISVDWTKELSKAELIDIDTMGAQACSGPIGCEV